MRFENRLLHSRLYSPCLQQFYTSQQQYPPEFPAVRALKHHILTIRSRYQAIVRNDPTYNLDYETRHQ